jgi:hypothetical protein
MRPCEPKECPRYKNNRRQGINRKIQVKKDRNG